jgi:hypothetical protein
MICSGVNHFLLISPPPFEPIIVKPTRVGGGEIQGFDITFNRTLNNLD